jgi:hypothetical protein
LLAFVLAELTLVISVFMHNFWLMEEGLERNHELQNFVESLAIMAGLLYVAGAKLSEPIGGPQFGNICLHRILYDVIYINA